MEQLVLILFAFGMYVRLVMVAHTRHALALLDSQVVQDRRLFVLLIQLVQLEMVGLTRSVLVLRITMELQVLILFAFLMYVRLVMAELIRTAHVLQVLQELRLPIRHVLQILFPCVHQEIKARIQTARLFHVQQARQEHIQPVLWLLLQAPAVRMAL
jgi:hypothetical protein